jgi:uncharacterized protein YcfL
MRAPDVRVPSIRLFRRFCLSVLAVFFLSAGCGSTQNIELAKDAVEQFHTQLDTEQYKAVYTAADDKFHSSITEADFSNLLEAIHRKLGMVQKSDLRNTRLYWYPGQGSSVTLVYSTTFTAGKGVESFVWRMNNNRAALYSYYINSNDLIVK